MVATNKVSVRPDNIRKIGVRSRSKPDEIYSVLVYPDGMITCPCKGYQYKKHCYHVKRVLEYLKDAQPEQEVLDEAPAASSVVDSEALDRLLGS